MICSECRKEIVEDEKVVFIVETTVVKDFSELEMMSEGKSTTLCDECFNNMWCLN
jgi:hypothetical protein